MEFIFLSAYDFFRKNRPILYAVFLALFAATAIGAFRIRIEEDVSRFFPNDKKLDKLNQIFRNSKLLDKLVVMVSLNDSTRTDTDSLIGYTQALTDKIPTHLGMYVKKMTYRVEDETAGQIIQAIHDHLPLYLSKEDYGKIDSLTTNEGVAHALQNSYRQLISPAGIALKKIIVQDPLGISFLALKKLQHLQYDEGFELVDNYIFTRDHRYQLFFITPSFPPNDTGDNAAFLDGLQQAIDEISAQHPGTSASFFGAAAVAAGNARQLRIDTALTVSLMLVLLIIFLLGFLRKKRAPLLIMIPVVFGGLFALAIIYLIQGSISALAIAAGSVILGIAVNYSLHFLSHLRHVANVRETLRDLVRPMTLGSTTTVLAFFCLQFTNAAILRDVGLFAGFSLIGAALCSLLFLPHLVNDHFFGTGANRSWFEKVSFFGPAVNRFLVPAILVLTPLLLYFAGDVKFNSDMTQLNFMSPEMKKAEQTINHINRGSLRSVYIVADGTGTESALRHSEAVAPVLEELKQKGLVTKYSSVSSFILSDSLQRHRLQLWTDYWSDARKTSLMKIVQREGEKLKFTAKALNNVDTVLNRNYSMASEDAIRLFRSTFFDDYISENEGTTSIVTLASVPYDQSDSLYKRLAVLPDVHGLDRRMVTTMFVSYVNADFTFIVAFTSALVFFVLLISYGRLELTLITFIPMLITWIWILGFMALFRIEFNIVNVMVSTFIFGLGDDYSIFIMDGLQQEYATGRRLLPPIKDAIFLSAVTTTCGLGVLIVAQHPALRSIAAISIIGILCVFVMSQTLEPYLFDKFIAGRARRNLPPVTVFGFCTSVLVYFMFALGAFLLTIFGFVFTRIIPFNRKGFRLFYHSLIRRATGTLVYAGPHVKKLIINAKGKYDSPKVIICNHESFLDILLTTMIDSRVLLFTNRWVWNSPIFGGVVRLADYYPIGEGAENMDRLRQRVADGYSILVFPEGSRSEGGPIRRFHKGAFFLAEKLQLDIQPLLLHGTGHSVPKGEFYVQSGQLTMKYLDPVPDDDSRWGVGYAERAKSISRYFKSEHARLAAEIETPFYFRHKLISTFLYKGPVLEWYLRIKLKVENYYAVYDRLIPKKATVLDLGCGYGFASYLLHFCSRERTITGVDFDADKIAIANHGYTRNHQLHFECADITGYPIGRFDAIILSDVLHYLEPGQQTELLRKCFNGLSPGGRLLIRDGDRDLKGKQKGTALTEFFSVTLLRFNKANQALHFISGSELRDLAHAHGLEITTVDETKYTSNVTFVVEKKVLGVEKLTC